MNVQKIGIVGAGTMGNGIAQAFAVAGFDVVLTDVAEKALQQALNTISGSLDRLIKKEKATPEQKAAALAKIAVGTDLGLLRDCGLIIEAATENEVVKRKLFAQLDEIAQPQAILAHWREDLDWRQAVRTLRARGRTVVVRFPGQSPDEGQEGMHCQTELVQQQGQWVEQPLTAQA